MDKERNNKKSSFFFLSQFMILNAHCKTQCNFFFVYLRLFIYSTDRSHNYYIYNYYKLLSKLTLQSLKTLVSLTKEKKRSLLVKVSIHTKTITFIMCYFFAKCQGRLKKLNEPRFKTKILIEFVVHVFT